MKCLQNLKEKNRVTFFVFTVERGGISFLPSSVLFLLGNPFHSVFVSFFALHKCKCLKIGDQQKSKIFQAIFSFLAIVEVSNF